MLMINFNLDGIRLVNEPDKAPASRRAIEFIRLGQAEILMKGLVDTSIIMKEVLSKEMGLRTDKLISHVAIFDIASYHKVFMVTDAAMNIAPSLAEKKT